MRWQRRVRGRALLGQGEAETALHLLLAGDELRGQVGVGLWPRLAPVHAAWLREATDAVGEPTPTVRATR